LDTTLANHPHNTRLTPGIALKAWAKINLSLIVLGKREDGYHDLHTVMAAIDLNDDLHFDHADRQGIFLECSGRPVANDRDNLVVQAARLLAESAGIQPRLKIRLHKRIPIGAGLGGGSSDAATCLAGLNLFWNLNLPIAALARLAAVLGSDVAFFLYNSVALCTGRGEIVQPIPQRCRRPILLIIPDFSLSTRLVYSLYSSDIPGITA
jgi:4-diphosphocytidyl-2-C-methyl-D-erythritol kinase